MEKCLVIVGRSKSAKKFTEIIVEPLVDNLDADNFAIETVDSLGDFAELDGLSRFIAFVLVDDESHKKMRLEQLFSSLMSLQMGVRLFENFEDAKTYAEEHYLYNLEFEDEEEEYDSEYDDDEYPRFKAEEIEDFFMFESLFRTGKLATVRGRVYGNPVTVMAHVIHGPDQIRVTPYAIMVSEDILENMELPKIDERD
jgi:hypothetical protein